MPNDCQGKKRTAFTFVHPETFSKSDAGCLQMGKADREVLEQRIAEGIEKEKEETKRQRKKRHKKETCSGMEDPRKVSIRNAEYAGFDACKRKGCFACSFLSQDRNWIGSNRIRIWNTLVFIIRS